MVNGGASRCPLRKPSRQCHPSTMPTTSSSTRCFPRRCRRARGKARRRTTRCCSSWCTRPTSSGSARSCTSSTASRRTSSANPLADEHLGRIVHGLDRITEILKLLIQQLDVLETMTPLDFLDFRDLLMPASGFQSMQFRAIETRLGLKREGRLLFDARAFDDRLSAADRARLADIEGKPKLVEQLDRVAAPHAVPARRFRVRPGLSGGGREDAEGRRGARAREPGADRRAAQGARPPRSRPRSRSSTRSSRRRRAT